MPLILSGNVASAIGGGYEVANSCRFDGSSGFSKSSVAGTRTKATFSAWVKRGTLTGEQHLFWSRIDVNNGMFIRFTSSQTLEIWNRTGGSNTVNYITNSVYRDPSAWMHVLVVLDTTQGTAGNRVKLFVNGTQVTSFGTETQPSQNSDLSLNTTSDTYYVGTEIATGSNYFNGYMAEVVYQDGVAGSTTDYGEFDEDTPTVFKPIDVSGLTFGNSGFYLDFEDSGNLGNDVNGGTDLTENSIVATDSSTDTPTNNFCTLNPLTISGATLSEGNLKYTQTQATAYRTALSTFALDAGKWYWEVKVVTEDGYRPVSGIAATQDLPYYQPAYTTQHLGKGNASVGLFTHGDIQLNGSSGSPTPATLDDGDITGFALDLDSGTNTLAVYKNGTLDQTYNLTTVGTYGSYTPAITGYHTAGPDVMEINFGSPSFAISSGNSDANGYGNFEYSVPSGYLSLCTKNLGSDGG